jgi:hypothetical protein
LTSDKHDNLQGKLAENGKGKMQTNDVTFPAADVAGWFLGAVCYGIVETRWTSARSWDEEQIRRRIKMPRRAMIVRSSRSAERTAMALDEARPTS